MREIQETSLRGTRVQLTAVRSPEEADTQARWLRDSEFARLLDSGAHRPVTGQWIREVYQEFKPEVEPDLFIFILSTQPDQVNIGFVGLEGVDWVNGNAWLGIGIGARDYWGKGYGGEAVRLALAYGFNELNLTRVSLSVFEYNPRAIRAYQRAGFVPEGRLRGALNRDGQRWDVLFMGILREEWERLRRET